MNTIIIFENEIFENMTIITRTLGTINTSFGSQLSHVQTSSIKNRLFKLTSQFTIIQNYAFKAFCYFLSNAGDNVIQQLLQPNIDIFEVVVDELGTHGLTALTGARGYEAQSFFKDLLTMGYNANIPVGEIFMIIQLTANLSGQQLRQLSGKHPELNHIALNFFNDNATQIVPQVDMIPFEVWNAYIFGRQAKNLATNVIVYYQEAIPAILKAVISHQITNWLGDTVVVKSLIEVILGKLVPQAVYNRYTNPIFVGPSNINNTIFSNHQHIIPVQFPHLILDFVRYNNAFIFIHKFIFIYKNY